ncbi:hypothetical protein BS47DRAFT_1346309 [Hydnum rufescens UP504]|uniref:Uncharacterized protein n=1 Tax=Hydnum rufescens UP504 TaxID=1448309 RepID=A0A9P6ATL8_9AGAM|nr:hypothetical protein BS47DRAFT_1346309 [Hydnum rufescens UP504]
MIRYKAIIDRSHTPHIGGEQSARLIHVPLMHPVFFYIPGGQGVRESTKEATKHVYLVWLIFRTVLEILASFNVPKFRFRPHTYMHNVMHMNKPECDGWS